MSTGRVNRMVIDIARSIVRSRPPAPAHPFNSTSYQQPGAPPDLLHQSANPTTTNSKGICAWNQSLQSANNPTYDEGMTSSKFYRRPLNYGGPITRLTPPCPMFPHKISSRRRCRDHHRLVRRLPTCALLQLLRLGRHDDDRPNNKQNDFVE